MTDFLLRHENRVKGILFGVGTVSFLLVFFWTSCIENMKEIPISHLVRIGISLLVFGICAYMSSWYDDNYYVSSDEDTQQHNNAIQ